MPVRGRHPVRACHYAAKPKTVPKDKDCRSRRFNTICTCAVHVECEAHAYPHQNHMHSHSCVLVAAAFQSCPALPVCACEFTVWRVKQWKRKGVFYFSPPEHCVGWSIHTSRSEFVAGSAWAG